jgi:hypothetical protein
VVLDDDESSSDPNPIRSFPMSASCIDGVQGGGWSRASTSTGYCEDGMALLACSCVPGVIPTRGEARGFVASRTSGAVEPGTHWCLSDVLYIDVQRLSDVYVYN